MINTTKMFERLEENKALPDEMKAILEKILTIKSPMLFDDTFATNEQLDNLEQVLEDLLKIEPEKINFINLVKKLKPVKTNIPFI